MTKQNKHHKGVMRIYHKLKLNPYIKWIDNEYIVNNGEYDIIYHMFKNLFYFEYKSNDNYPGRLKAIDQTYRFVTTEDEFRLRDYDKYGVYIAPGIIKGLWKKTKKGGLERLFDDKFLLI